MYTKTHIHTRKLLSCTDIYESFHTTENDRMGCYVLLLLLFYPTLKNNRIYLFLLYNINRSHIVCTINLVSSHNAFTCIRISVFTSKPCIPKISKILISEQHLFKLKITTLHCEPLIFLLNKIVLKLPIKPGTGS